MNRFTRAAADGPVVIVEYARDVKTGDGRDLVRLDLLSDQRVDQLDDEYLFKGIHETNVHGLADYVAANELDADDLETLVDEYLGTADADDLEVINRCVDAFDDFIKALDMSLDARDVDEDDLEACCEAFGEKFGIRHAVDGDFKILEDVKDDADLGMYVARNVGYPDDDRLVAYIDLEMLADDYELGSTDDAADYVREGHLGDDPDPYFDYEAFGHDCYGDYTGGYTSYGFVYTD